jgi:exopolyphosphatase/guanosine-5'-triphosphate,3'-diphosphate pyrophosphatase
VDVSVGWGEVVLAHRHQSAPLVPGLPAWRALIARAEGAPDAEAALADLWPPPVDHALAVGGSATSLYRLVGPYLSTDVLDRALALLGRMSIADVAQRYDLHPERIRLLPAGMLLLRAAAQAFGVPLAIAAGGLREGVVFEELARRGALAMVAD